MTDNFKVHNSTTIKTKFIDTAFFINDSGDSTLQALENENTGLSRVDLNDSNYLNKILQELKVTPISLRLGITINEGNSELFANIFLQAECIEKIKKANSSKKKDIFEICHPTKMAYSRLKIITEKAFRASIDDLDDFSKIDKCAEKVGHSNIIDIIAAGKKVPLFTDDRCHSNLEAFNECKKNHKDSSNIYLSALYLYNLQNHIFDILLNPKLDTIENSRIVFKFETTVQDLQISSEKGFSWTMKNGDSTINLSICIFETDQKAKTIFKFCPIFKNDTECRQTNEIQFTIDQDICKGSCLKELQKIFSEEDGKLTNGFLRCLSEKDNNENHNNPGEPESTPDSSNDTSSIIGVGIGLGCIIFLMVIWAYN